MPDIIQEQAPIDILPTERGGTPTSPVPPAEEDQSLGAHIEQFHEQAEPDPEQPAAQPDKPKGRHRAMKDRATARDVPRIQALSAEVKEWKAKYEAAIAAGSTPKEATKTANAAPPEPIKAPAGVPEKFTFDTFEQWAAKHPGMDPQQAWDAWENEKLDARDAWKADRQQVQAADKQQQEWQQQAEQAIIQKGQTYQQQLDAYVKANPTKAAVFQNVPQVPPLMLETIWGMDNAPHVVHTLLTSPGMFQEMHLLTDGKPISQQNVANATTWLRSRLQTGTTGAVARVPNSPPAPRPPTPVRTTPMPPPQQPPGDSGSLLEHNSYFKTAR